MGTHKKEAARRERKTTSKPTKNNAPQNNMSNIRTKGENFYRDAKKVKTLSMLNSGKAQRNADGKITKAAVYQSREKGTGAAAARIEPNRKWFGNTRVIAQDSLTQFRDAVKARASDPYSFLMKSNKLPMSLIRDEKTVGVGIAGGEGPEMVNGVRQHQAKIAVESRPFGETFGPKAQRKRVKLDVGSVEEMAGKSGKMLDDYQDQQEQQRYLSGQQDTEDTHDEPAPKNDFANEDGQSNSAREPIFSKGQSKRIWNEAYKVIDASDVVCFVLDARDPEGTRCRHLEKFLKEEAPHKHILFLLNKCDLVPTKIAAATVRLLSKQHPTLAFHASLTNSFGKGTLITTLRQFSALHSHRRQLSVGLLGYPNTGKSSIINTLRKKRVCTTAPIPGETKVWQYVTLMRRIFLIDAPGVVPPSPKDRDVDILLRGVVRVENVEYPAQYIPAVLERCERRHVERTYDVKGYTDSHDFLERLARRMGKLFKGGEPDVDAVAKMVINDFLRGKIPWFVALPEIVANKAERDNLSAPEDPALAAGQGEHATSDERPQHHHTNSITALNKEPALNLRAQQKKRRRPIADQGDDETEGAEVEDEVEEAEIEARDIINFDTTTTPLKNTSLARAENEGDENEPKSGDNQSEEEESLDSAGSESDLDRDFEETSTFGFGSSSDDDDDDGVEREEEVGEDRKDDSVRQKQNNN